MSFSGALVSLLFAIYVYFIGDYSYLPFELVTSPLVLVYLLFSRLRRYSISYYIGFMASFSWRCFVPASSCRKGLSIFSYRLGLWLSPVSWKAWNLRNSPFIFDVGLLPFPIGLNPIITTSVPSDEFRCFTLFQTSFSPSRFAVQSHFKIQDQTVNTSRLLLKRPGCFRKNREITDSITYAVHLQKAILPPLSMFSDKYLSSILFYKPKRYCCWGLYHWKKKNELLLLLLPILIGTVLPGAILFL